MHFALGYNPTDAEKAEIDAGLIPECRAYLVKKFPEDPALTNKWIAALYRDPKEVYIFLVKSYAFPIGI